ncbi:urease accessory protein UreE [Aureimonas psammosilenae]|uniref:urease accessory protein UreE n=1 Tax=Aureimonas psammosilenae TaxID=2495496 RepID=UPI00126128F4|nr:urease accessory protein UreE [Aureimonas psammosilenae]
MIRAETIRDRHEAFEAADTITLDETQRHRRRMAMVSDNGIAFLLDLSGARLLREGDGVVLDDGRVVKVVAKPEPLYAVRGQNAAHLLTLAWHLGNRHQAAQILSDHILIRREPVIREMLQGLRAIVEEVDAPFDPEGGAYGHHSHGDEARSLTAAHSHHG